LVGTHPCEVFQKERKHLQFFFPHLRLPLLSLSRLVSYNTAKVASFPWSPGDEAAAPLLDMANDPPRTSGTFDRKSGHDQYDPEEDEDEEYGVALDVEGNRRPANRRRWTPSAPSHVLSSDPDLEGLSLYDKKCVLINREIDAMGMGKYQWMIWGLCGFGYLLDLLWAQAFGLTLSPLQQELGFGNDQSGNISTAFSAGLTAGAFFWGALSDVVGMFWLRRPGLSSSSVQSCAVQQQHACV
jgi:hypothetical protein